METTTNAKISQAEKPCRSYERGNPCKDGRDHCFNCGRHLDPESARCSKKCGEGNDEADDAANGEQS